MTFVKPRFDESGVRLVSLPLMVGLLTLPTVCGWLLLRRGYANSLRLVVLVYALAVPLLGLLALGLSLIVRAIGG